jgi:hypothetical protein
VIGIFKQKSPVNFLLLLVFGVLLKLPIFNHPVLPHVQEGDSTLYAWLVGFIHKNYGKPMIFPVLSYVLQLIQALLLTRFINRQRMMSRSNFFPGMAYMLITSLFPEWNYFSAPLLVNTILLFGLITLFRIYNAEKAKGAIFNIGLSVGLASFIYFPSVTFIFWVLIGFLLLRPFRLHEWALCLAGVVTPFYFYAIYLFVSNQWDWQKILPHVSFSFPVIHASAWFAISIALLVLPFLAGAFFIQGNLMKMLVQVRKGWSLLLLYLLGALLVPFVSNNNNMENWVLTALPFAAFHACAYLYPVYRFFPLALFWLSVGFVLAYQYYGPGW